jgi:hypothetical protein
MANVTEHALSRIEDLARQLAHLRKELAERVAPSRKSGSHALHDAQHQAVELARDLQEHGSAAAHLLGRQARHAGKAISKDPIPLVVALGTFVLLSSLFARRRR